MEMNYYILAIYLIVFIGGELLSWILLKSKGVSISPRDYYYSQIFDKSIFAYKHNKRIVEALQKIQHYQLDIIIMELANMYKSHVNVERVIDALLLMRSKSIKLSKEDFRTLAYSNKDFMQIINDTKPGEQIRLEEIFRSKLPVLQK
jgi:uncharacterized protein YqfA (UPF0365 family)